MKDNASNKNKIRIMQFPSMFQGGVGSVVMNIYRNIDRSQIEFDFSVSREDQCPYHDEVINMGGKIFYTSQIRKVGFFKKIKNCRQLLRDNGPYDAVHIHSIHMGAMTVYAAKKEHIPVIYHVHNTKDPATERLPCHKFFEWLLNCYIRKNATICLACGQEAGEYIYGKKHPFSVINNGIQVSRFYPYPSEERKICRAEFGFTDNDIVIGNIARFNKEKNQVFLLKLIAEDKRNNGNLKLLLTGDGPLFEQSKKISDEYGINDRVVFTGARSDVEKIYNSMDVFCLPSFFEGLPVTAIEAQACGVPCVVSSNVTSEANLEVVPYHSLALESGISDWMEKIYGCYAADRAEAFVVTAKIKQKKYDTDSVIRAISSFYEQIQ